jgi:hypothetical protein
MTAKELLARIIEEGLPPEGWGRWVWKGQEGYGLSALVTNGTLPPVEEEEGEQVLFWWGDVRKADIPYWPELFIPEDLLPDEGEGMGEEELREWWSRVPEKERAMYEEWAEKVLTGVLLAEAIKDLPDGEWEEFVDGLRGLSGYLEAQTALQKLLG